MHRRRALALAAVAVLAIVALCLGRAQLHEMVTAVIAACRRAGPWVYFGAMAVLPVFGFSLFAFVVSADPVFGPVLGTTQVLACGLGALAVNVTLSYVLAAWALRPWAARLVGWLGYRLPDEPGEAGSWEIGLLVRLLPGPPFGLQSCLLGLANMPFGTYLATSIAAPAFYFTGMVALEGGFAAGSRWAMAVSGAFLLVIAWACRRLKLRLTARTGAARSVATARAMG